VAGNKENSTALQEGQTGDGRFLRSRHWNINVEKKKKMSVAKEESLVANKKRSRAIFQRQGGKANGKKT